MNDGALQYLLLMGACLSLIGLGLSGVMVSRAQTRNDRRAKRLDAILSPHIRSAQIELSAFTVQNERGPRSLPGIVAGIFGFSLERTALYPTRWYFILSGTFAVALGARYAASDLLGAMSWAALPLCWVVVSRMFFNRIENKRRSALLWQFPDALAMIVRSIRVGVPVIDAVRNVSLAAPSPTAGEFNRLVDRIAVGTPLDEAVTELAVRTGLAEYRFFATALALQTQTGGTLSETLENLADVIRKRAALKARGHAMTAEARTSSAILAMLPIVTGGMLYALNPNYMMLLFTDPTGKTFFSAAVISLSLGMLAIRAIIKSVLP
ncbi:MAG: type II secretion system F family protein [Acetobacteraceae bacterium]|nr:type II secretion system F family protein [Acetobacteraceae bacterium]